MPDDEKGSKGFDELMRDLEDDIFGVKQTPEAPPGAEAPSKEVAEPARRQTLPTLIDKPTANKILQDFMKEKNQRKYEVMGVELIFKPYWFFTYTCELIVRDKDRNIIDSQEIGGRVAADAINGGLADYLQDLLDHEPIEVVDLADEMAQVGEAKILEPKISDDRLERFIQQKISGVLRADKENVSVAGFELMWSPVYRFWLTIKKKTHNAQIDGCGGYPVNYDDIPLKEKTWADRIADDIDLLRDPKKWREFLKKKGKAMRSSISGGGKEGKGRMPGMGTIEAVLALITLVLFLFGLSKKPVDWTIVLLSIIMAVLLFWYMNHQREKPLMPLPPPPFMGEPQEGG